MNAVKPIVKMIPPKAGKLISSAGTKNSDLKRVAAYARVSTDNEEQLSSFDAQMDYYTRHIQSNPAWKFVGLYSDEGISATSTKKRDGFNRMITDALEGKIDLIITKSVSRFARNTIDSLTTVRQLKEKGVEVYFDSSVIIGLNQKPLQMGGYLVLFSFISEQFYTNGGVIVRAAASGEHPLT